jgi:hypothetical protein
LWETEKTARSLAVTRLPTGHARGDQRRRRTEQQNQTKNLKPMFGQVAAFDNAARRHAANEEGISAAQV